MDNMPTVASGVAMVLWLLLFSRDGLDSQDYMIITKISQVPRMEL